MNLKAVLTMLASLVVHPTTRGREITGEAAWYGREQRGHTMANGKPFDERNLTCATWFYPLGTELKVTDVDTGRYVYVTCTDRGPAWRLVWKRGRVIDLSFKAFERLRDTRLGHIKVTITNTNNERINSIHGVPQAVPL